MSASEVAAEHEEDIHCYILDAFRISANALAWFTGVDAKQSLRV